MEATVLIDAIRGYRDRDAVTKFFSQSGALRGRPQEFVKLFLDAYKQDPELAILALFHARDVRGGNGERANFRAAFKHIPINHNQYNLLYLIPHYGRFDDLVFMFPHWHTAVSKLIKDQLNADLDAADRGDPCSLLAKWLPSENTSSKSTRDLAKKIRMTLYGRNGSRQYRRVLSYLRRHIRVVERDMSANTWGGVDYERVPSQAMRIYRKAFARHDGYRFDNYLKAVQRGEARIQAGTLDPHQIVFRLLVGGGGLFVTEDATLEALWANLPDRMSDDNMLVVCDTSGSMFSVNKPAPIDVAVSLAIYAAERNRGIFYNHWINFSGDPTLQVLRGETLSEKLRNIDWHNWGSNTDLRKVFRLILQAATHHNIPTSEMPTQIVIISDMKFNTQWWGQSDAHEGIQREYTRYGYDVPKVVYWNVNSSSVQQVDYDQSGVMLVSGFTTGAFAYLAYAQPLTTPEEHMLTVLMSERYAPIREVLGVRERVV